MASSCQTGSSHYEQVPFPGSPFLAGTCSQLARLRHWPGDIPNRSGRLRPRAPHMNTDRLAFGSRGVAAFLRLKQNFPKAPLVPGYTPGLSPAHEAGPGYRARAVSTLLGVSRHKQKQAETSRFEQISPKLGRILPGALQRSAVPPPAHHRAGWAARRCPRPLGPRPHNTPHTDSPPSYGGKRENGEMRGPGLRARHKPRRGEPRPPRAALAAPVGPFGDTYEQAA